MKKTLVTITYSNIDRTDGPVIHYMELWNSFVAQFDEFYEVIGFACVTNKRSPFLIESRFPINVISSEYFRPFRLLIQDLYFAFKVFTHRNDVVYLRTGNNMCFSVLISKILRVALVTEYNGIASMDAQSNNKGIFFKKFVSFMERFAIKSSTGCIAVSKGIEEYLTQYGARKTACIRNGVSPDFFSVEPTARPSARKSIVYVGTFTPWDGARHIITLARQFPDVDFYLIGEGHSRKAVEAQVGSDNVFFKDFVDYGLLKSEYAKHDAGIILYEVQRNSMELSSLKTLEYLATGLPVFSTRVPGQEFIESESVGVLANIDEIDRRFEHFLAKLDTYKANVKTYRAKDGLKHSWDRTARETFDFINSLCGNPEKAPKSV